MIQEGDTRHLYKYCDLCVTWNTAEPLPGGGGGHRLLLLLLVARQLEKQAQDRLGGGHPVITLSANQRQVLLTNQKMGRKKYHEGIWLKSLTLIEDMLFHDVRDKLS